MTEATALPVVEDSIIDGETLHLYLPSNVTLVGVGVNPRETTPKIMVTVTVTPVGGSSSRSIALVPLDYIERVGGASFPVGWNGRLRIGDDFPYKISVNFFNWTGTAKRVNIVAYVDYGDEHSG